MQIRLGTRQDESIIRTIVSQAMEELKTDFDLTGRDSDLANIESSYFWHDGIFIVAEEDGQIVGLSGARRAGNEEEIELVRLVVIPSRRRRGLGRSLLSTVVFFAANLDYKRLLVMPGGNCPEAVLRHLGFSLQGDESQLPLWAQDVTCPAPSDRYK